MSIVMDLAGLGGASELASDQSVPEAGTFCLFGILGKKCRPVARYGAKNLAPKFET